MILSSINSLHRVMRTVNIYELNKCKAAAAFWRFACKIRNGSDSAIMLKEIVEIFAVHLITVKVANKYSTGFSCRIFCFGGKVIQQLTLSC